MNNSKFIFFALGFALFFSCSGNFDSIDPDKRADAPWSLPSSGNDEGQSSSSSFGKAEISSSSLKSSSSSNNGSNMSSSSSSITQSSSSISEDLCANFDSNAEIDYYGSLKKQICDERDGQKYVYATIGTQVWMAENLNYNANGSICYNNLEANCDIYGRLYGWETAMNGAASSTASPSGVRGICPSGWHIPSVTEWATLITTTDSEIRKLKANSDLWASPGLSSSGFSALPSGYCVSTSSSCPGLAGAGYWWSSVHTGAAGGTYQMISNLSHSRGNVSQISLYSVRCVQD